MCRTTEDCTDNGSVFLQFCCNIRDGDNSTLGVCSHEFMINKTIDLLKNIALAMRAISVLRSAAGSGSASPKGQARLRRLSMGH